MISDYELIRELMKQYKDLEFNRSKSAMLNLVDYIKADEFNRERALHNLLYSTLILPDICGKLDITNKDNVDERYKTWVKTNITAFENEEHPLYTATFVYALRNCVMHPSSFKEINFYSEEYKKRHNVNIDIKPKFYMLKDFESPTFIRHNNNDNWGMNPNNKDNSSINLCHLCWQIILTADKFYRSSSDEDKKTLDDSILKSINEDNEQQFYSA